MESFVQSRYVNCVLLLKSIAVRFAPFSPQRNADISPKMVIEGLVAVTEKLL